MKMRKKMVSFLMVVCCLLLGAILAYASDADEGTIPRVTFTNTMNQTPDLYVTKHVESASSEYSAPADAVFTFVLKLDGKLANREEYQVFDADGSEVKPAGGGVFTTSRSGSFTLKDGQTAKFSYVGAGTRYEVSETGIPTNFQQIQPAGGASAQGTVPPTGARAEFTNLYQKSGGGGGNEKKTGSLVIRKEISFPSGYELPETPEFTFKVKIDGKAYKNEDYAITNTASGREIGKGTTDQSGAFVLAAGNTVTFTGIPANVDYEVTEEAAEGWRAAGQTGASGAIAPSVNLAIFNNVSASFAVTKTMEDGSKPDKEFTFQLMQEDRSVWPGASYYLYTTAGKLVDEQLQSTAADGAFVLKPGQAAVFVGIDAGTRYHVREISDPDYVQVTPQTADGYADKRVTNAVEILPFVNRENKVQSLNVTKLVESKNGDLPLAAEKFTFILSKKSGNGYQPVSGAVYSVEVGTEQSTYRTDADGKFSIAANETAKFTSLTIGEYKVEETDLPRGYEAKDGLLEQTGTLGTESLSFTFTNVYELIPLDLKVVKKSSEEKELAGAEFTLYQDKACTEQIGNALTTGSDGVITLSDLKVGTYYLKETKAPDGYYPLAKPITITVKRETAGLEVSVSGKKLAADRTKPGQDTAEATVYNTPIRITKELTADGNETTLGTAGIGDFVAYEINTILPDYPEEYFEDDVRFVIADVMSDGLDIQNTAEHPVTVLVDGTTVAASEATYAVTAEAVSGSQADLTIAFAKEFIRANGGKTVKVTYYGKVNAKAVIGEQGNPNRASLTYSDQTSESGYATILTGEPRVYTFSIAVEKFETSSAQTAKALAGAQFKLYTDAACQTEYKAELPAQTSDSSGKLSFARVAAGTYYLKETKVPAGYVLRDEPIKVEIIPETTRVNGKTVATGRFTLKVDGQIVNTSSGAFVTRIDRAGGTAIAAVENYKGYVLPATGGSGIGWYLLIGLTGMILLSAVMLRKTRKSA